MSYSQGMAVINKCVLSDDGTLVEQQGKALPITRVFSAAPSGFDGYWLVLYGREVDMKPQEMYTDEAGYRDLLAAGLPS